MSNPNLKCKNSTTTTTTKNSSFRFCGYGNGWKPFFFPIETNITSGVFHRVVLQSVGRKADNTATNMQSPLVNIALLSSYVLFSLTHIQKVAAEENARGKISQM